MKEKIPITEVLAWLQANHPELHAAAEIERDWLWLSCDLRGDHNKAVRDSIGKYGFRFCKRGHTLPSGRTSHWAHSCTKPIPFKHHGKASTKPTRTKDSVDDRNPFSSDELSEAARLFA
jgi:hypothetical protein